MKTSALKPPATHLKRPDIVYREGQPAAVILDIADYEALLERLEDQDDLAAIQEMKKRKLEFIPLSEFLSQAQ
jgi:PHD/YefM family antitoxin component YafN of YafNO toxin-antitoxin module